MSIAKELYPESAAKGDEGAFDYGCFWESDYTPILNHLGTVALQVDDDDYQGDSRVLYRDGERWGVMIFGWGSCTGCDALQGSGSWEEVDALIEELRASIKWFDTTADALTYFVEHDWLGDYCWHADETKQFVEQGTAILKAAMEGE